MLAPSSQSCIAIGERLVHPPDRLDPGILTPLRSWRLKLWSAETRMVMALEGSDCGHVGLCGVVKGGEKFVSQSFILQHHFGHEIE